RETPDALVDYHDQGKCLLAMFVRSVVKPRVPERALHIWAGWSEHDVWADHNEHHKVADVVLAINPSLYNPGDPSKDELCFQRFLMNEVRNYETYGEFADALENYLRVHAPMH